MTTILLAHTDGLGATTIIIVTTELTCEHSVVGVPSPDVIKLSKKVARLTNVGNGE